MCSRTIRRNRPAVEGPSCGCHRTPASSGRHKQKQESVVARSEWSFASAVELSAALKAKKVSATELAQDAIGRIERHDAKINAVCVRDFERGLAAAREADAGIARGETRPLLGL